MNFSDSTASIISIEVSQRKKKCINIYIRKLRTKNNLFHSFFYVVSYFSAPIQDIGSLGEALNYLLKCRVTGYCLAGT